MKAKRLRWAVYVWQTTDKFIHKVLKNGKRLRGVPRQRWLDRVSIDLESLGATGVEDTDDRERWFGKGKLSSWPVSQKKKKTFMYQLSLILNNRQTQKETSCRKAYCAVPPRMHNNYAADVHFKYFFHFIFFLLFTSTPN